MANVAQVDNIFNGLKSPKSLMAYRLMQGVPDYADMGQFNLYESSYQFFKIVKLPTFLEKLMAANSEYEKLVNNYKHIIENDFKGLEGIEDIEVDTFEITNGITTVNMISKANMQSGSSFTSTYYERTGSILTRLHNLFITGIKDPKTQVKTYHGLIKKGLLEAGYENEVFTYLYIVTDNTARQVEKAYLLLNGQPSKAEESIYNGQKGNLEQKEITVQFNAYPITGPEIYTKAQDYIDWMNNEQDNPNYAQFEYDKFKYSGVSNINVQSI